MTTTRDALGPTIIAAASSDEATRALLDDVYGAKPAHVYAEWPHRTCATCAHMTGDEPGDGGDGCYGDTRIPGLTEWLDVIPVDTPLRNVTDAPTLVFSVFDPCGACHDQRATRSAAATPPALVKLPAT